MNVSSSVLCVKLLTELGRMAYKFIFLIITITPKDCDTWQDSVVRMNQFWLSSDLVRNLWASPSGYLQFFFRVSSSNALYHLINTLLKHRPKQN